MDIYYLPVPCSWITENLEFSRFTLREVMRNWREFLRINLKCQFYRALKKNHARSEGKGRKLRLWLVGSLLDCRQGVGSPFY